jgi:hypothetical protein
MSHTQLDGGDRFILVVGSVECEVPFSYLREGHEFRVLRSDGTAFNNGAILVAISDADMRDGSIKYIERSELN